MGEAGNSGPPRAEGPATTPAGNKMRKEHAGAAHGIFPTARCNQRCWSARLKACHCPCNGENHGALRHGGERGTGTGPERSEREFQPMLWDPASSRSYIPRDARCAVPVGARPGREDDGRETTAGEDDMHETTHKNTGTGSFEFVFQLDHETGMEPLVEAIRECVNTGPADWTEERFITIQGEFDFGTAEMLTKLAREARPWYKPKDASIAPPLDAETVQEALDIMLEFQQQDDDNFVWGHIPMGEMPQQVLHALHRMVAAEWVQPDYERPDIAMATTPQDSQGETLRQLLGRWDLTPERIFQREL